MSHLLSAQLMTGLGKNDGKMLCTGLEGRQNIQLWDNFLFTPAGKQAGTLAAWPGLRFSGDDSSLAGNEATLATCGNHQRCVESSPGHTCSGGSPCCPGELMPSSKGREREATGS